MWRANIVTMRGTATKTNASSTASWSFKYCQCHVMKPVDCSIFTDQPQQNSCHQTVMLNATSNSWNAVVHRTTPFPCRCPLHHSWSLPQLHGIRSSRRSRNTSPSERVTGVRRRGACLPVDSIHPSVAASQVINDYYRVVVVGDGGLSWRGGTLWRVRPKAGRILIHPAAWSFRLSTPALSWDIWRQ